jgi:hypothetical protein
MTAKPLHVFEVQIGGNLEQALTKLKHTWDKWNRVYTKQTYPRKESN